MRDRTPQPQSHTPMLFLAAVFIGFSVCMRVWLNASEAIESFAKPAADQRLLGSVWWRHDPFALESLVATFIAVACFGLLLRVALRVGRYGFRANKGLCEICAYPRPPVSGGRCTECGRTSEEIAAIKRREWVLWSMLLSTTILASSLSGLLKALPGTFDAVSIHGEIFGASFRQNDLTSVRRIGVVQVAQLSSGWGGWQPKGSMLPTRVRIAVESVGPPPAVEAVVVHLDERGRVVSDEIGAVQSLWRRNGAVLPADVDRLTGLVEQKGFMIAAWSQNRSVSASGFSTFLPDRTTSIRGVFALILVFVVMGFLVWLDLRLARRSEEPRRLAKLARQPQQAG